MMNYLEYPAIANGDATDGRAAYHRYGRQAMRAVHGVGGQFRYAVLVAHLPAERRPQRTEHRILVTFRREEQPMGSDLGPRQILDDPPPERPGHGLESPAGGERRLGHGMQQVAKVPQGMPPLEQVLLHHQPP